MNETREEFRAFDDTRAGTCEVGVCVDGVDAVVFDGVELEEAMLRARGVAAEDAPDLLHRLLKVEAARHDDEHLRVPGDDLVPRDAHRVAAFAGEFVNAAGELYQFRHPVAACVDGMEPLHTEHARAFGYSLDSIG